MTYLAERVGFVPREIANSLGIQQLRNARLARFVRKPWSRYKTSTVDSASSGARRRLVCPLVGTIAFSAAAARMFLQRSTTGRRPRVRQLAPLCAEKHSQRFVHCPSVRKCLRHIRLEKYQCRARGGARVVLPLNPAREGGQVILRAEFVNGSASETLGSHGLLSL